MSPGGLCAVLADGRRFVPDETLAFTEETWITLTGVLNRMFAEFMWRDWEWSSFVTPDQVLILPCPLRQEGAALPPSCGCTWGCFKWGKWHLGFLSACVLHGEMVLWDTASTCTQCCFKEQLFMFPSGNWVIRNSGTQICFGMSVATFCICFRDIDACTRYHNIDHYVRFLQDWVALWICVLNNSLTPDLNFYPFIIPVELARFLKVEYSEFEWMQWIWGIIIVWMRVLYVWNEHKPRWNRGAGGATAITKLLQFSCLTLLIGQVGVLVDGTPAPVVYRAFYSVLADCGEFPKLVMK